MEVARRPILVTLVGIIYFILGLFILIGAILYLVDGTWDLGLIDLFIGMIYLLVGFGCFKGWGWIWILAIIITILYLILTVVNLILNDFADWLSPLIIILISLFVLWYLFTPKVKRWFGY
ncbi:MAG TPA: hypothetical protein VMW26_03075 [Methanomassiliicoccales archaeon]|nr:hypothetical protein [Methanomassiliicoccales archaeon]